MDIDETMQLQAGVISRRQIRACGVPDTVIRRRVRRREWARVHPGVYVDHTGPLTWLQRAWAAVLWAWPSALSHSSALRAAQGPGRKDADDGPIHVVIDHARTVVPPEGVVVHRSRGFGDRVHWNLTPPRVRYEDAALDVAQAMTDDFDALGVVAAACQSRRTTAARMLARLEDRTRIGRRAWLAAVLRDVADGTCSVLEHEFLARVERPHGLPSPDRQVRASATAGLVFRDAQYDVALVVELDGRLYHDSARRRDQDFERDLDAAVDQLETLRISWGQAHARPCSTAAKLVAVLQRRGWNGEPYGCGPGCPVGELVRETT